MTPLHSPASDTRQLDLLAPVPVCHDDTCHDGVRLAVPCGKVNAQGVRCLGLGTRPLRIEGEIQYLALRPLVHCDWQHCYLAAGTVAAEADNAGARA